MQPWLERLRARFRSVKPEGVGAVGERIAAAWLERNCGFRILARNWKSPRDQRHEIDLVALDQGVLVFVEVKSRPSHARVPGYFAATKPKKKAALLKAIRDYVRRLREKPHTVRFDVVEVQSDAGLTDDERAVRHFENVPLFTKGFLRGR